MSQQLSANLEVIPYDECIEHLGVEKVGRLGWVRAGAPVIAPVNFAWDGEAVVFRSDPGPKLHEVNGAEVAFEVGQIDQQRAEGWSVVVLGPAAEVQLDEWPPSATRPERLGLEPFAPGLKLHWLRLVPRTVSGRRVRQTPSGPAENPFWRLSASD